MPEIASRQPILIAIKEPGGSAKMSDVLERLEQWMKEQLLQIDYEPRSASGTPCWNKAAQCARNG